MTKIIKQYEENGIKITQYASPKRRPAKHIIKGKPKITAKWSEPTKKSGVSSVYRSEYTVTPVTAQTGRSTDNGSKNREWGQQ